MYLQSLPRCTKVSPDTEVVAFCNHFLRFSTLTKTSSPYLTPAYSTCDAADTLGLSFNPNCSQ